MCSSSSVVSVSLCLLMCLPPCLSSGVTVKPGEDATLPCRGPKDAEIRVIKWTKPDLESDLHVFYYRHNRLQENYQHPSYQGRVKLNNPEMKDGDVSVILKNVTFNDAGRYKCYVGVTGSEPKLIRDFNLEVTDSGDTDEQTGDKERGDKEGGDKERGDKEGGDKERGDKEGGDNSLQIRLGVGLTLAALLMVGGVVGGSIFYRKRRKPTEQSSPEVRYTAAGTGQSADHVQIPMSSSPDP